MEAAVAVPFFIGLTPRFAWYFFIIRASDVVLSIFEIFSRLGVSCQLGYQWVPVNHFQNPLVAENLNHISKIERSASLALTTKRYHINSSYVSMAASVQNAKYTDSMPAEGQLPNPW